MSRLTIFSWGYWGWGNATQRLVEVVDAVERDRGFGPPTFVDIRISRSVRAKGFSGDAFRQTVGVARYRWMPELGNVSVVEHTAGIRIRKPEAAEDLLEAAIEALSRNSRVLFYCSCEIPGVRGHSNECHRTTVAHLLLDAARRQRRSLEVVEWPGGEPITIELQVDAHVLGKIRGGLKSVPLHEPFRLGMNGAIPWCSIAILRCREQSVPVLTGPARCDSRGWYLPVLKTASRDTGTIDSLIDEGDRLRRGCGYAPLSSNL